jgi:hypothetical protein
MAIRSAMRQPYALPVLVAALAAGAAALRWIGPPQVEPDFALSWAAARALVRGADPYVAALAVSHGYPLYYPMTAAVAVLPIAWLPLAAGHVVFAALSGFAYGAAARRLGPGAAAGALSACFVAAAHSGQWSPLLMAGAAIPALGVFWAAKPSIGSAWFVARPGMPAVYGGTALLLVSLALRPAWPVEWLRVIWGAVQVAPILRPGGWLLLLALVRWRRPEARLLAALALVPQMTLGYEALPVFFCVRTKREGYALAVLSWIAVFGDWLTPHSGRPSAVATAQSGWPWLLWLLYVPAVLLVLRSAPAERRY